MGRDAEFWAKSGKDLRLKEEAPKGAINLNIEGRSVTSPIQGFGKMWQKTYKVDLGSVDPKEVISVWKGRFGEFWPEGNRWFGPLTAIAPGDVALLNLSMPGGVKLSTGMMVLYADDESFTLMTPQGHMFAGWITFSAEKRDGSTVAQIQVLMRASDPLYEMGLVFGVHRRENRFWDSTLTALAANFGIEAPVEMSAVVVDKKRQWKRANNIFKNAAIRTVLYSLGFRRKSKVRA